MYSDKRRRLPGWLLPAACIFLIFVLLAWLALGHSGSDVREEGALAIRETIRRSALQCYAVEGVYPPDLEYLEKNYGLQVNTKEYYVTYDAFASNLPPTVIVKYKG